MNEQFVIVVTAKGVLFLAGGLVAGYFLSNLFLDLVNWCIAKQRKKPTCAE